MLHVGANPTHPIHYRRNQIEGKEHMELSIADIKALLGGSSTHSIQVGKAYFIRGVTLYYTGRVSSITDEDIVLEDAAWIGDTGRWSEALSSGTLSEVEPFPGSVIIPRGTICDISEWKHPLPTEVK